MLVVDRFSKLDEKDNFVIAQNRMKKQADLSKKRSNFQARDEIYLKLRLYRKRSLVRKRSEKLSPKFFGSYRSIEGLEKLLIYRLELPHEASIHDILHISQLQLKLGHNQQVQHHFSALIKEFEP